MNRKRLRIALLTGVIYLVITVSIAVSVEKTYRSKLGRILSMLGKDYFKDSARITSDLKADSELHRYGTLLRFTPPIGWFTARRLEHLDDTVIFASRNYALPESQSFADPEEARSFGFDPAKRTDEDLSEALMSAIKK